MFIRGGEGGREGERDSGRERRVGRGKGERGVGAVVQGLQG